MLAEYVPPTHRELKRKWCSLLKRDGVEDVVREAKSDKDLFANLLVHLLREEYKDKEYELKVAHSRVFNLTAEVEDLRQQLMMGPNPPQPPPQVLDDDLINDENSDL